MAKKRKSKKGKVKKVVQPRHIKREEMLLACVKLLEEGTDPSQFRSRAARKAINTIKSRVGQAEREARERAAKIAAGEPVPEIPEKKLKKRHCVTFGDTDKRQAREKNAVKLLEEFAAKRKEENIKNNNVKKADREDDGSSDDGSGSDSEEEGDIALANSDDEGDAAGGAVDSTDPAVIKAAKKKRKRTEKALIRDAIKRAKAEILATLPKPEKKPLTPRQKRRLIEKAERKGKPPPVFDDEEKKEDSSDSDDEDDTRAKKKRKVSKDDDSKDEDAMETTPAKDKKDKKDKKRKADTEADLKQVKDAAGHMHLHNEETNEVFSVMRGDDGELQKVGMFVDGAVVLDGAKDESSKKAKKAKKAESEDDDSDKKKKKKSKKEKLSKKTSKV